MKKTAAIRKIITIIKSRKPAGAFLFYYSTQKKIMFRQLRHHSIRWTRPYSTPIQTRLDYNKIAENPQAIKENMIKRNHCLVDPYHVKTLYEHRLENYNTLSHLRSQRNTLSKATSNKNKNPALIQQAKELKQQIKQLDASLSTTETELLHCAVQIPNDTHPDVPVGPESNARIIKIVNEPQQQQQQQQQKKYEDHVTIATRLDMIDLEQAAIVSGSSFYYLQGYGAFLETALIQYAMDKAASKGFLGVITPDIVRTPIAYGCGFQPRAGESSQIYHVQANEEDELCLAGTAEIPLAGKFATKVLEETELPKRLVGFGRAYRAEAGGRGTETKGLYRVHQFSKVELFAVSTAEQSDAVLEQFREIQEEMFTELGLCFR